MRGSTIARISGALCILHMASALDGQAKIPSRHYQDLVPLHDQFNAWHRCSDATLFHLLKKLWCANMWRCMLLAILWCLLPQRSAQLQGFPVVYFRKNGIPSFTTTTKALLSYRHSTTLLFHVLNDSKQSAQVTITQLSHIQKLSPEIYSTIQQPSTTKEQKWNLSG